MPGDVFYSTPEWRALRVRCLKAQRWRCAWCGASIARPGTARVDHILTRKERPDLELVGTNVRGLCTLCDARRHADKGHALVARLGADASGWPTDPAHHWNAGPRASPGTPSDTPCGTCTTGGGRGGEPR